MRALITGINGFVGPYLTQLCLEKSWEVHGLVRSQRSNTDRLTHFGKRIRLAHADITDAHAILRVVEEIKPDIIFHLAGQTHVPTSISDPSQTMDVNVRGTLNLMEAIRATKPYTVLHIAGSSDEYGMISSKEPITESQPLNPRNPYGVSKASATMLALQYAASYDMPIFVTRAFSHSGSGRPPIFAESDWARQIAEIELGLRDNVVWHGNLDAVRDYTHVKDIVRGYMAVVDKGKVGQVYNLCSGVDHAHSMKNILDALICLSNVSIKTGLDQYRMRPSDNPMFCGDYSKAKTELGWEPSISVDKMLSELLDSWRDKVRIENKKKVNA